MITGICRARNEELILEDTIKHYLKFCEELVMYDDASTDRTFDIMTSFDRVIAIHGHTWQPTNETDHRANCMRHVRNPWVLCFDADERIVGRIPDLTIADGFQFKLYDAYMTPDKQTPYTTGELSELPRMYGPERRDIIMLFNRDKFFFGGQLQREPLAHSAMVRQVNTYVKHFGKALSIEHWEETCDYYSTYFPEPYTTKWKNRKGKAIHTESDFGHPLYEWNDVLETDVLNTY